MTLEGNLAFFRTSHIDNPKPVFAALLALSGAANIWYALRTEQARREWNAFQYYLQTGDMEENDGYAKVAKGAPLAEVPQFFVPGGTLIVEFAGTALGARIEEATSRDIPESIRGTFNIGAPILTLGWHDIFEFAEEPKGQFFGRAFFSFKLMGYSTPNDWKEYRRRIFEVSEIRQLKADIEKIVGPVEQCIYWSV